MVLNEAETPNVNYLPIILDAFIHAVIIFLPLHAVVRIMGGETTMPKTFIVALAVGFISNIVIAFGLAAGLPQLALIIITYFISAGIYTLVFHLTPMRALAVGLVTSILIFVILFFLGIAGVATLLLVGTPGR